MHVVGFGTHSEGVASSIERLDTCSSIGIGKEEIRSHIGTPTHLQFETALCRVPTHRDGD